MFSGEWCSSVINFSVRFLTFHLFYISIHICYSIISDYSFLHKKIFYGWVVYCRFSGGEPGLCPRLAVVNVCASFSVHLFPPDGAVPIGLFIGWSLSLAWPHGLVSCCNYLLPLTGIAYGAQPTVFWTQTDYREGNTFFFSSSEKILVLC